MPTTKDWSLAVLILAVAALVLDGMIDTQEVERSHRQYCKMVAQWDKDAALGVAPERRTGWPPYNGRKQCEQN